MRVRTKQRGRILCVEDEDTNVRVFELALEDYEITRARSAEEAAEFLMEQPPFDLILMDIQLRGSSIDGVDLTRILTGKQKHPSAPFQMLTPVECPIVFVTAYGSNYPEALLMRAGGVQVLEKPINPTLLQLAVATHRLGRIRSSH